MFEDPVPLGVRFHGIVNAGERWVTRWVDDVSFRSVAPGGFASATITLRIPRNLAALPNPDPLGFSQLTELFRRVQIVDLRTCEIAWEGRIEDPARQVDPDTWQIGALGSMVAASDVQRPVFYVDSSMDRWVAAEEMNSALTWTTQNPPRWSTDKDDTSHTLTTSYAGINPVGTVHYSWRWDSHGFDQPVGRVSVSMEGAATSSSTADLTKLVSIIGLTTTAPTDGITWSSGPATQTKVLGGAITDTNQRIVALGSTGNSYTYVPNSDGELSQKFRNPVVLGQRRDRFANKLITTASYPNNYVTVAQVVEDVVGRFLVGGWYEAANNAPWPGSVRGQDVYIDATDTTHILHLLYTDGATAADILNDMMTQVQTDAFWAIWESKWQANNPDTDFPAASGFRFEWATWPDNYGYLASSQDGFEGQPNGDDTLNFLWLRYQDTGDNNVWHASSAVVASSMTPELYFGGFTRAITVNKSDPADGTTAGNIAVSSLNGHNTVLNAGTLTVKRPIAFFDAGVNSASGGARMLDPWMIRPGRLVKITDLPPRAIEHDVSFGTTAPDVSQDGTVFRVVATEYQSSDNSCRMELDQVTRWQVPTQISSAASGASKTIRIQ